MRTSTKEPVIQITNSFSSFWAEEALPVFQQLLETIHVSATRYRFELHEIPLLEQVAYESCKVAETYASGLQMNPNVDWEQLFNLWWCSWVCQEHSEQFTTYPWLAFACRELAMRRFFEMLG